MNKFYVYTVSDNTPNERQCIYVDSEKILGFAAHEFEPSRHVYSGVMVEADNPSHAHEVYNTFNGEIIWTDEPTETAYRRQDLASAQVNATSVNYYLARLFLRMYARATSEDLLRINERLSRMAEKARSSTTVSPERTTEQLYESIKDEYIKALQRYKYVPRSDPYGPHAG